MFFKNLSPGAVGISATMEECIEIAKAAGFEGMDVNLGEARKTADEKSPDAVKAMFADAGLRMGGNVPIPDFRKDEETFQEGLKNLPEMAKLAQQVGVTRAATWIMPASDELPFDENFEQHRRRLRAIAEVLNDHGIGFGLEFVGPKTSRDGKKYEFIWDMAGMLKLCDAVGTPNMGLLLDCWHWYTSRGTVEDIKALKANQVVYVHVNDAPKGVAVDEHIDNQRAMPGETGVIDIGGFLNALKDIGYDGPITAEPFNPELRELPPAEAARRTAESLDNIWKIAGLS